MKTLQKAIATLLVVTASAFASQITLTTSLSGANESPANASPATGAATVTLDDIAQTLRIEVQFSGLTGTTTASHIHCCTLPTAGVATTTPTFFNFPLGVKSGTYDNTLDLTLASSYNPAFVTANGNSVASAEAVLIAGLLAGQAYLNIHSSTFGAGEIRGFLVQTTPEPATFILAGAALLGLALRRRISN